MRAKGLHAAWNTCYIPLAIKSGYTEVMSRANILGVLPLKDIEYS